MKIILAAYKGPATGFFNKSFHLGVCMVTDSIYSHCELIINGVAYSASARDKGVRKKEINFSAGHWDFFEIDADVPYILEFFNQTDSDGYDYLGLGWFIFHFIKNEVNRWFCSEWCGTALKLPNPSSMSIRDLVDTATGKQSKRFYNLDWIRNVG